MYWARNHISSVGSSVSVFGVLIFFSVIANLFSKNNIYYQGKNGFYVIVLNRFFSKIPVFVFDEALNTHVFKKFKFLSSRGYTFLDKYALVNFWKTYFFEFNAYIRPGVHVYDLFDDLDKFDIFVDLNKATYYQWFLLV